MLSHARKSNTANPFIIFDFFNQLEEVGDDTDKTFFALFNLCTYIVLLLAMKY